MIPLNNKALKVFKLLAVKTLQTEKTIETVKKVGYILKPRKSHGGMTLHVQLE